jgi:hypothetical protein
MHFSWSFCFYLHLLNPLLWLHKDTGLLFTLLFLQGGLAMLELRNLSLVNLCSLTTQLASGTTYTSAVSLALFNRTG